MFLATARAILQPHGTHSPALGRFGGVSSVRLQTSSQQHPRGILHFSHTLYIFIKSFHPEKMMDSIFLLERSQITLDASQAPPPTPPALLCSLTWPRSRRRCSCAEGRDVLLPPLSSALTAPVTSLPLSSQDSFGPGSASGGAVFCSPQSLLGFAAVKLVEQKTRICLFWCLPSSHSSPQR